MDERSLVVRKAAPKVQRRAPSATPPSPDEPSDSAPVSPPAEAAPVSKLEAFCLGALVRHPEALYTIDRELQTLGLAPLAPEDFVSTDHQLIMRALHEALHQLALDAADYLREHVDVTLRARLEAFTSAPSAVEASEAQITEALLMSILRLRKRAVRQWLTELRFFAEDAREQGDVRAEAYERQILQQAQALAQVDRALARQSKSPTPHRAGIG